MFEINFNKIMEDLVSDNSETQCIALEQISDMSNVFAEQSVKALEVSQNSFLIAERLIRLGSIIVKPLENFVETATEGEKRTLASLLLLQLGSQKGLNDVIAELKNKGKNEYLASRILVESNIPDVGNLIIERLKNFSSQEFRDEKKSIYIGSLLTYLDKLGIPFPPELKKILETASSSPTGKYYKLYESRVEKQTSKE